MWHRMVQEFIDWNHLFQHEKSSSLLSNAFEKNGPSVSRATKKRADCSWMSLGAIHADEACPKISTWQQLVLQKDECFNLFATKSGSLSCKLSIVISNCSATFSHQSLSNPHLRKARTPKISSPKDKPRRMTQQTSQGFTLQQGSSRIQNQFWILNSKNWVKTPILQGIIQPYFPNPHTCSMPKMHGNSGASWVADHPHKGRWQQQMDGNVIYFHPQTNWRFSDDFPLPTAALIEWAPNQAASSRLKVLQIVAWKLQVY